MLAKVQTKLSLTQNVARAIERIRHMNIEIFGNNSREFGPETEQEREEKAL